MKVSIKDVKKALAWVEANTQAEYVHIDVDGHRLVIKTVDKYDKNCELTIYCQEAAMMPTVTSTDKLR